jgi:hypothetical protein
VKSGSSCASCQQCLEGKGSLARCDVWCVALASLDCTTLHCALYFYYCSYDSTAIITLRPPGPGWLCLFALLLVSPLARLVYNSCLGNTLVIYSFHSWCIPPDGHSLLLFFFYLFGFTNPSPTRLTFFPPFLYSTWTCTPTPFNDLNNLSVPANVSSPTPRSPAPASNCAAHPTHSCHEPLHQHHERKPKRQQPRLRLLRRAIRIRHKSPVVL